MQTIILKVKNESDISLLISLAKRLGISIVAKTENVAKETDNTELFAYLHKLRKNNKLFSHVDNPVVWQKEMRKDRKLLNRD